MEDKTKLETSDLHISGSIFSQHLPVVKIKPTNNLFKMPKKAHPTDACYDVWATSKEYLEHNVIKYGLGFSCELPKGCRLDLRARSSIYKTGLILSNCIGTGDEGYTGEYMAVFYHILNHFPSYKVGDKILQIHVEPRWDVEFVYSKELSPSERGTGGFGSTGKN